MATVSPSLAEVQALLLGDGKTAPKGNTVPVYATLPADLITPVMAYLRLSNGADVSRRSFLCESVVNGEKLARYSFAGADPYMTIRSGPGLDVQGDPLKAVQAELDRYEYIPLPGLPKFTGGAMGYVSYDCIQYFEPRTARPLKDPLGIPESVFMLCDHLVVFDHMYQSIKCVAHVHLPGSVSAEVAESSGNAAASGSRTAEQVAKLYSTASAKVQALVELLSAQGPVPAPVQEPVTTSDEPVSNIGREGYHSFVKSLKKNIVAGDIIQAVPSQRLSKKTQVHPFNVYRMLRQINPSPYMFYVDCGDCQLVGASPETLCKVESGKVAVHAIAGTVKRGKTDDEDAALGQQLLSSTKDRAEHVMLVDLARNDISRVCDPRTTQVESFMKVEKFSHVMHLTSRVTGMLRQGKTRFDALRSIFPAGTVSGAPKVRAIELVSELEGEKRGVYAGAVGHVDFGQDMDVCIAIRTMTFKDGVAYLQAGGGIVFDSEEEEEYIETINKLNANVRCLKMAEDLYRAPATSNGA